MIHYTVFYDVPRWTLIPNDTPEEAHKTGEVYVEDARESGFGDGPHVQSTAEVFPAQLDSLTGYLHEGDNRYGEWSSLLSAAACDMGYDVDMHDYPAHRLLMGVAALRPEEQLEALRRTLAERSTPKRTPYAALADYIARADEYFKTAEGFLRETGERREAEEMREAEGMTEDYED